MITQFLLRLKILPRWVIVIIDLAVVCFSSVAAYTLRFNFVYSELIEFRFELGVFLFASTFLFTTLITKSYAGIVRYTGLQDGLRVLTTLFMSHLAVAIVNFIHFYYLGVILVPNSIIIISFLTSFVLLYQYRLLVKNIFSYYATLFKTKKKIAIFGAGQMGIVTKHLLDADKRYEVVAFFEDDSNKAGKVIGGVSIYSFDDFFNVFKKIGFEELIIAINNLSIKRTNDIVDDCLTVDLMIRKVPKLETWVQGELKLNQIREVQIDELLERDSITLQNSMVSSQLQGKVICVTGGAGSIGSELVRQIATYKPKEIVIIDQAESATFELKSTLRNSENIRVHIADISNSKRIRGILEENIPDIVYHAAAYKHVPLMEENPYEAVNCNIIGTRNLADICISLGVERFVMVSTDKAVNPTSVMGASKRIAEMYVQSIDGRGTSFVTTRFGNVLGSNGSVIPHFKKQIASGGPVTVTHPEIMRYFMTIGEACELILEAGCMGNGGEIYLFDMGKSIKIVNLAEKMIKLSGYEPYKDIDIVFTGLRQGEKLYEELLANEENTIPTHHPKILKGKISVPKNLVVKEGINTLIKYINANESDTALVSVMKSMVPEFKSNSSVFQLLDA